MTLHNRFVFKFRRWFARWTHWEYWPLWAAALPVFLMYGWFALRARHWLFFSAANPALPLGGAFGESKSAILRLLPQALLPKTVFAPAGMSFERLSQRMEAAGLRFPVIAKPDIGERGFLVKKIASTADLRQYLAAHPVDFIVQEFLTLPLEMSVFFYRFPGENGRFGITSVCRKEFLSVTGDGRSTVGALMLRQIRAAFQWERLQQTQPELLKQTPAAGQILQLGSIGNHSLGTKFVNANHLIDAALVEAFEPFCRRLEGIHYGRFDLKCASVEALRRGRCKIMELNGAFSDPAHVFDPAHGMWRAYRDYYRHWRLLYRISRQNHSLGNSYASWREALQLARAYFAVKKAGLKHPDRQRRPSKTAADWRQILQLRTGDPARL